MTDRRRPADRRHHETIAVEMLNQRFKIGIGRHTEISDADQALVITLGAFTEVFVNAQKPNSALDVICSDGAILMSLLIQYGCPIETIQHAMKKDPGGSPASPLGYAANLLSETLEANHGS